MNYDKLISENWGDVGLNEISVGGWADNYSDLGTGIADTLESKPGISWSELWSGLVSVGNTALKTFGTPTTSASADSYAYRTAFGNINGSPAEAQSSWDILKNTLLQTAVKVGLATPVGQQVQQEAIAQTADSMILKIIKSPVTWILLLVGGFLVFKAVKK